MTLGALVGAATLGDTTSSPTAALTVPEVHVDVAFGAGPWDTPTWYELDGIRSVSISRGRHLDLEDFSAGSATVELANADRTYDPCYVGSPYYPNLVRRRPVRVRVVYGDPAVAYAIFGGTAERWDQSYDRGNTDAVATLEASDRLAVLATARISPAHPFLLDRDLLDDPSVQLAGPPEYGVERSGSRAASVLATIGATLAHCDCDPGLAYLQADQPGDVDALAYLQSIAAAELGACYCTAAGTIRFADRATWIHAFPAVASAATFSDDQAAALRYQDLELDPGSDRLLRNEVIRTVRGGAAQTRTDPTSIDRYGRQTDSLDDMLAVSDADAAAQAEWMVGRYADPVMLVDEIRIVPRSAAMWAQVLIRDVGDKITVERRPQGVGTPIRQDHRIEGVAHEIRPGGDWRTTWSLSAADPNQYFRLDDPTYGVLDGPTVLAY